MMFVIILTNMKMLLLILSLPTENATARMRAWRALKACGAAVLRDGVYLLPTGDSRRTTLADIAAEVNGAGGQAWLLQAEAGDDDFTPLFDRTDDYHRLAADIEACFADAATTPLPDLLRLVRKLRKACAVLVAIDFYPGEAQRQVMARLAALDAQIRVRTSPDEPFAQGRAVQQLDASIYRGRVWATRRRPWVDRLASAWLIRRFIDREATFIWLSDPAQCPPEALGFDYDGAAFTHTGDLVSFETLLHSFGLMRDPALLKVARLVHFLDVGGLPVAEAPGVESVLVGMRASLDDDDALLAAASQAFDFMYANYRTGEVHGDRDATTPGPGAE